VSKLVGLADHEAFEGVTRIQLMVRAFEVQLGLLDTGNGGSGLNGLFLGANVLHFGVGRSHLMEDGLYDFAVGARQDLAEHGAGNLHVEKFAFSPIEAGGLKPSGVGIDADSGFDQVQEPVPDILRFALANNLSCSSHRNGKPNPMLFPQVWINCGKRMIAKASRFVVLARAGTKSFVPLWFRAVRYDL